MLSWKSPKVSVPVEKERIVIERSGTASLNAVTPTATAFQSGEVARVEAYEEKARIGKEAFVSEEVNVRKEVDRDVVAGKETLRREKLKVDTDGNPVVQRKVK
ncbi:MAG: YsnF/AvaK domain-containing protein [Leptolyngbyaceae cyanobacterium]